MSEIQGWTKKSKIIPENKKKKLFDEIYQNTVENHEGCWLWAKSCFKRTSGNGYGQKKVNQINWHVHRLMYTIVNGCIKEGTIIRHRCGNSLCCNPLHLEEGTLEDNAKDSIIHGTSRFHKINQYGVNNHIAKLNEDIVYEMRKLYATGENTFEEIAEMYNVSRKAAERAVRGQTYPDFTKVPPIPVKKKRSSKNV